MDSAILLLMYHDSQLCKVYDEDDLVARSAALQEPLRAMLEALPSPAGAVRCMGLLAAVDLDVDQAFLARRHT